MAETTLLFGDLSIATTERSEWLSLIVPRAFSSLLPKHLVYFFPSATMNNDCGWPSEWCRMLHWSVVISYQCARPRSFILCSPSFVFVLDLGAWMPKNHELWLEASDDIIIRPFGGSCEIILSNQEEVKFWRDCHGVTKVSNHSWFFPNHCGWFAFYARFYPKIILIKNQSGAYDIHKRANVVVSYSVIFYGNWMHK